ncbi:MAG TPA: DUF2493 domain-containing protein [Acidobacteriaceae bacterium]|jgi:predicted Rossmann-fold nucleotide-binding protein
MRVLICGSRKFKNKKKFDAAMDRIYAARLEDNGPLVIIHGAAKGADTLAKDWAEWRRFECIGFPAKWDDISHPDAVIREHADGRKYNLLAGFWRNREMLEEGKPDLVIAFPGGDGTAHMVKLAKQAGVEVVKVRA